MTTHVTGFPACWPGMKALLLVSPDSLREMGVWCGRVVSLTETKKWLAEADDSIGARPKSLVWHVVESLHAGCHLGRARWNTIQMVGDS